MSRTYVILTEEQAEGIVFSEVLETSPATIQWNVDPAHTKTFVKFNSADPTPSFLDGLTQYTHAEIIAILETPEWSPPEEE